MQIYILTISSGKGLPLLVTCFRYFQHPSYSQACIFFFFFFSKLRYSLFKTLYYFQVYSMVIFIICRLHSIIGYCKTLGIIPCYSVNPCCLSILCIVVCICQFHLFLPLYHPFGSHKFVYKCFHFYIDSFVLFFKFHM